MCVCVKIDPFHFGANFWDCPEMTEAPAGVPPAAPHHEAHTETALRAFIRNFSMGFSVRAGIAVLGRIIRLLRSS